MIAWLREKFAGRDDLLDALDAIDEWCDAGRNLGDGLRTASLGGWHLTGELARTVGFIMLDASREVRAWRLSVTDPRVGDPPEAPSAPEPAKPAQAEPSAPACPGCGGTLRSVTQDAGSPLNADQFDAVRAGDWWCEKCPPSPTQEGRTNVRYWWNRDLCKVLLEGGAYGDTFVNGGGGVATRRGLAQYIRAAVHGCKGPAS